ncbi:porin family protein [Cryomorpha ignava]|uniref:Porin family protein n=1 Tax=Cryomorpha ignava TaxID=101383 RepID=A0A7K3WP23_9FLAO|nr:outer membrane beta-barrel protein [Cryomorpha ignava]NEN23254.1 porin family protein [Cryomorpha ignava]
MKNIFTLLIACMLAVTVSAQTEGSEKINYGNRITKGTVLLTGDVNFANASNDFSESNEFSLNFGADFALSKRFAIGLGVGYEKSKFTFNKDTPSEGESEMDAFTIAPAFTLFGDVNFGWLQPTATLAIPISFGERNNNSGESDLRYTAFGGLVSGGFNIYLSRKLALTASLGLVSYSQTSYEDSDDTDNRFSIGFGTNNLNFGLLFLLGSE